MSEIPPDNVSDERLKEILLTVKTIAVVGASRTPGKPAHFVPLYLKSKGYNIIPVNPFADEIFGLKSYKSLLEIPEEINVELVDVFRPSEEVKKVIEEAVKRKIKIVWLQEGIYNEEAVKLAKENGIEIIWNRCIMKTHRKLLENY